MVDRPRAGEKRAFFPLREAALSYTANQPLPVRNFDALYALVILELVGKAIAKARYTVPLTHLAATSVVAEKAYASRNPNGKRL